MTNVKFLHRRGGHVFISVEDPTYRYEWLCGHCDYPVTESDPFCPRCQKALEECPVCSHARHVRVSRVAPDGQGERTCPVCHVRRIPFGRRPLEDLRGSFCTNIYGCPAGGFLLRCEEFALLPHEASQCPICRDPGFQPLDVRTFLYHVTRCQFCSAMFAMGSDWQPRWKSNNVIVTLPEASQEGGTACALCGRCDTTQAVKDGREVYWSAVTSQGQEQRQKVLENDYLRMAELGRILMLEPSRKEAFTQSFNTWFDSGFKPGERQLGPKVSDVAAHLLDGTRPTSPTRRVLQKRVEEFLDAWARGLPEGLNYRVPLPRKQPDATHERSTKP